MARFLSKLSQKKNNGGFTLTELIVVVTILGILTSIVTPSVITYINDAKVEVDAANAKIMSDVVQRGLSKSVLVKPLTNPEAVEAFIEVEIQEKIPTCEQLNFKFYINVNTGVITAKDVTVGPAANEILIDQI